VIRRVLSLLRDRWQISRDPVAYARRVGVRVGESCLLAGVVRGMFGTEPYLISLGNHVAMASGVRFITHDGGGWVFREEFPDIDAVGRITVGDNVMLGMNAILLPGCEIGSNTVIGAGSVVTGKVPSGVVFAGVPAKFITSLADYRERMLESAIFVAHLPHEQRRQYFERFLDGEIDGHLRPIERPPTA
jgi:acetyltransferase-like isoleucine patch superfamily enzyme